MVWLILLLLSGCTTLPEPLQGLPAETVSLDRIREHQTVLLGGQILRLQLEPERSWAEVVAYPLGRNGRPDLDRLPEGRFWFWTRDLLDPEVYQKGREVTVIGVVEGSRSTTIGKRTLELPVIQAERYYLWPPREKEPVVIYAPPPAPYWYPPWHWCW